MERTSRLLGGLGAGLAILVAGVGGISWATRDSPSASDGKVIQYGEASPAETSQNPTESRTGPPPAEGLSVEGSPLGGDITHTEHWIVSSSAIVEEFPVEGDPLPSLSCLRVNFPSASDHEDCLSTTPGCTPEQRDWLAQNAVLARSRLFTNESRMGLGSITLKNTSTSGQSIAFKDIYLEATFSNVADSGFSIVCTNYNDWSGGVAASFVSTRAVVLPAGSGNAVFGEPSLYGEDLTRNIPAGMPAVVNLAAGETVNLHLSVEVPAPVGVIEGQVFATVAAADGEEEIKVPVESLGGGEAVYTSVPRPSISVVGGSICPVDTTANRKYTREQVCSFSELGVERHSG